ncbi:MAG: DUF554 domain-containing protein [Bacillota bacterium]
MLGTVVNVIAILIGSFFGLSLKKGISDRYKETILQGIGLATILIGLKMGFKANNELLVILSLVIGGIIGELLKIDYYLDLIGVKLQKKFSFQDGDFVKGFVSSSLIFCVGAMAILGAIESGISGNHKILFAKSTLDLITSAVLASSLGVGVVFSAIPVLVYQGLITILATGINDILVEQVRNYMSATGGMLIVGIGVNILGIKKINAANLLPSIFVIVFLTILALAWFPNFV